MMRHVLVVGAGGFIGRALVAALIARGDQVTCAGRDPARLRLQFPSCPAIATDLARDDVARWAARLTGVDAVVNAVGILRGDLEAVQARGAIALFDACAQANIRSVLQISALGAGAHPDARFLATKAVADEHLVHLAREGRGGWHVVRPSLVVGRGGASTALFSGLTALPRPLRLGTGQWELQPVHVSDLVRVLLDLLDGTEASTVVDVAGPNVLTTDQLTAVLGGWLGLPARRPVPIPEPLLAVAARIGSLWPGAMLTPESLALLRAGNVAGTVSATVARRTRPLAEALATDPAFPSDLLAARLLPVRPILLACLVAVWIGSGVVSLLLSPERAGVLLAGLGLSGGAAVAVTWSGALLDVVLGLGLLARRMRPVALKAQIAVMAAYTLLATVALPTLWFDPFGSLLKNLAVLAAALALLALEA